MTELERLKGNLEVLHKAYRLSGMSGKIYLLIDRERDILRQRIADLEAQQAPEDEWAEVKQFIDYSPDEGSNPMVKRYIRHLEVKIAELEAQQAQSGEWTGAKLAGETDSFRGMTGNGVMWKYVRHLETKVAELDNELRCERIDGGKVRDDQKAFTADRNREKLAELTTIYNAIPPACGLAKELVERRIESVKREIQESEAGQ